MGAGRTLQTNLALRHQDKGERQGKGKRQGKGRAQRANTLRSVGAGLICRQLAIATLGLVGAEQQIGALGSKLDLVGAPC